MPEAVERRPTKTKKKQNDANPGAVFAPLIPELMDKKTGEYLDARALAARAYRDDVWRHRTRVALVDAQLRIPVDADPDSAVMPTGIPERCRPAFRWQADRRSGACRPLI